MIKAWRQFNLAKSGGELHVENSVMQQFSGNFHDQTDRHSPRVIQVRSITPSCMVMYNLCKGDYYVAPVVFLLDINYRMSEVVRTAIDQRARQRTPKKTTTTRDITSNSRSQLQNYRANKRTLASGKLGPMPRKKNRGYCVEREEKRLTNTTDNLEQQLSILDRNFDSVLILHFPSNLKERKKISRRNVTQSVVFWYCK